MVAKISLLLIIGIFTVGAAMPAAAQGDSTSMLSVISKAGEMGGTTLALIIAMYWLRDMSMRRTDEALRYAESLKAHSESLNAIVQTLMKGQGQSNG